MIDRDTAKLIAILPMTIGHLLSYQESFAEMTDKPLWLHLLVEASLFAPPVFFFSIADGFKYTRSRKKYALRLLVFALITQIPFTLANQGTLLTTQIFLNLNIIFTLLMSLAALIVWDSKLKLPVRIAAIAALDAVTLLLQSEWMLFGILIVLGLHIFREKPKTRLIWFTVCAFGVEFISNGMSIHTLISPPFLFGMFFLLLSYFMMTVLCSEKKGKHPKFAKWFFYIFYPAHLLMIFFVKLIVERR
ncbi:TraX protein [Ruminococcus sp. YE71]|uniref:TraX family protein n=1 Tax=unclassified Ruminococcus TaxID=2608920 RepID=UPI0008800B29|nr:MULTISPECIES: TraX family protein [unclassified Ruminococcus]SDA33129.1 TraX protein [Ruminococcus sp. YE78]SFW54504.1 TraX protein [Ruminococcus sp. YE71]